MLLQSFLLLACLVLLGEGVLVSAEQTIHSSEVLTVVIYEVAVVNKVVTSVVEEAHVSQMDAIVDGGGPSHQQEEEAVEEMVLDGEHERTDDVGDSLECRVD